MTASSSSSWLKASGVLALALLSLRCGVMDRLTNTDGGLSIQQFTASPLTVQPGSTTTLSWDVEGATTVTIDHAIGQVPAKGSRDVTPGSTTTFGLSAQSGAATATASVQVVVQGTLPSPSPTPPASPSPSPTTPLPSPTPSATPDPSPTFAPPSPDPSPSVCGAPAGNAGSCGVVVSKPSPIPGGGCVEVNLVTVSQSCPVAATLPIVLRFDVTASTTLSTLSWRRAAGNGDVMDPSEGFLNGNGTTKVILTDVVLDSAADFEIVGNGAVVLSLSVRH
jgi:hypothetical protein